MNPDSRARRRETGVAWIACRRCGDPVPASLQMIAQLGHNTCKIRPRRAAGLFGDPYVTSVLGWMAALIAFVVVTLLVWGLL